MIIRDAIFEKTDIGKCPPIVPHKASLLTGFPEPRKISASRLVSNPTDLVISRTEMAKLEWTNPVEPSEDKGLSARYDFEGNETTIPIESGDYRSELHHHGHEPGKPGYTLEELVHLSQSGFQSQKALSIKALGAIATKQGSQGPKSRRQFHRMLIGEYKMHVRLAVACSDTSMVVRAAAWESLYNLILSLDKYCGCVIDDLSSIPEFFNACNPDDEFSVRVFLFMSHVIEEETLVHAVHAAGESFGLKPEDHLCGLSTTASLMDATTPAPEVIATLCDRVSVLADEPLSPEDTEFLERMLKNLRPSIAFNAPGQVDEYSWTNRCNMVITALTEFVGDTTTSAFLVKLCWLFTSSLFPVECRAAIWGNAELLSNMSRLMVDTSLQLLGNQNYIDFACSDITYVTRENSMIVRAIKNGCKKFLQDHENACPEMAQTAAAIVSKLGQY